MEIPSSGVFTNYPFQNKNINRIKIIFYFKKYRGATRSYRGVLRNSLNSFVSSGRLLSPTKISDSNQNP